MSNQLTTLDVVLMGMPIVCLILAILVLAISECVQDLDLGERWFDWRLRRASRKRYNAIRREYGVVTPETAALDTNRRTRRSQLDELARVARSMNER